MEIEVRFEPNFLSRSFLYVNVVTREDADRAQHPAQWRESRVLNPVLLTPGN